MTQDDRLDSLAYTLERYARVTPRMAFRGDDLAAWRAAARPRLIELIGLPTGDRVPLEPRYEEAKARPGYSRIPVRFDTRPGLSAFGYLLIPDDLKAPAPAMICLPGHGRGVDEIVGIAEDGGDRDHDDGYQHDFAVQCVRRGYVTLALEMLGFGHRRDPAARAWGPTGSSCQAASGAALMLGETMVGWRVWDTIRAIDLMQSRPEVAPDRIALMGISGGGTITLYTAAIDDRVKVSVLSCSFCTFRDSIYSLNHCIDNFVPGLLQDFEAADIAGLIAPRYLVAENGKDDKIFPEAGARELAARVAAIYKDQGAGDHFAQSFFDGGHIFHGAEAFRLLEGWL